MAGKGRPHNFTVLYDGSVVSLTPRELKRALQAVVAGEVPSLGGKVLGSIAIDFNDLTKEEAAVKVTAMFPERAAPAPRAAATPALEDLSSDTDKVEVKRNVVNF